MGNKLSLIHEAICNIANAAPSAPSHGSRSLDSTTFASEPHGSREARQPSLQNSEGIEGCEAMTHFGNPDDGRGLPQIRELCTVHLEALHNLHFLLQHEHHPDSDASTLLDAVKHHLNRLTEVLCPDR